MLREKLIEVTVNEVKKRVMNSSNTEKSKHADTVIKNHIGFSMGAGFIPIPLVDIVAVSAVQLDMIRQLSKVYELDFSETQGKAIVSALTSSTLARVGASSMAKMIPVIGTYLGGMSNSILAGASTFALGEVFKRHFEKGGTILDFDMERLKRVYQEKFEKGKTVAKEVKEEQVKEQVATNGGFKAPNTTEAEAPIVTATPAAISTAPTTDIVQRLKELADLKAAGILNEEEFLLMKKKLIEAF